MQLRFERALFVGAHLDDFEFGCGGLIAKYGVEWEGRLLTLSRHTRAATGEIQIARDLDEPRRAAAALGIPADRIAIEGLDGQLFQRQSQEVREILLDWRRRFDPQVVFVPSREDIHQDHHVVHEEAIRIFRDRAVLGFELVRSTLAFTPNLFVAISAGDLARKEQAIECYQSQLRESAGYYFDPEIIRAQARFRGGQCNRQWAEAFEVYFMHLP
jgi:LmbE family N-acetylglucosaminyl deacetylase